MEVDGRDSRDGVHLQALSVAGQLLGIKSVVAGHMGDDGELAPHLGHHILQDDLPLLDGLVDALAGGAADVEALDPLAQQVPGKGAGAFGGNIACIIIACVERRDDTQIFFELHVISSFLFKRRFSGPACQRPPGPWAQASAGDLHRGRQEGTVPAPG